MPSSVDAWTGDTRQATRHLPRGGEDRRGWEQCQHAMQHVRDRIFVVVGGIVRWRAHRHKRWLKASAASLASLASWRWVCARCVGCAGRAGRGVDDSSSVETAGTATRVHSDLVAVVGQWHAIDHEGSVTTCRAWMAPAGRAGQAREASSHDSQVTGEAVMGMGGGSMPRRMGVECSVIVLGVVGRWGGRTRGVVQAGLVVASSARQRIRKGTRAGRAVRRGLLRLGGWVWVWVRVRSSTGGWLSGRVAAAAVVVMWNRVEMEGEGGKGGVGLVVVAVVSGCLDAKWCIVCVCCVLGVVQSCCSSARMFNNCGECVLELFRVLEGTTSDLGGGGLGKAGRAGATCVINTSECQGLVANSKPS